MKDHGWNEPALSALFRPQLTLGPLLFAWPQSKRRDFYARIADEADFDVVYVGQTACPRREPFSDDDLEATVRRLQRGGKRVVRSTLALATLQRTAEVARELAETGAVVEANDLACLAAVTHWPHVVGPCVNVLDEQTQNALIGAGAVRIVYPSEVAAPALRLLAARSVVESEVQVFGRQPLSAQTPCHHASPRQPAINACQAGCGPDLDGSAAGTADGHGALVTKGGRRLSNGYLVLLAELAALRAMGVTCFRLSPQDIDMVAVAALHRAVLENTRSAADAAIALKALTGDVPWQNGCLHGREALAWVDAALPGL